MFPASLLETLFYLLSVFENTRAAFAEEIPSRPAQAGLLWVSAFLPYLIFASVTRTFLPNALYLLFLLTAVLAFWHVVLPRRPAYDLGFLAVAAAPFVTHVFARVYRSPDPHLHGVDVLGHLMWVRLGLMSLLVLREWDPGPVNLWPYAAEWRNGLLWFAIGIGPIGLLALSLGSVHFAPAHGPWWRIVALGVGQAVGFFCVVALGEELFFRGFIERAVLNWRDSPVFAVAVSAVLFAAVHLWVGRFPNWRWSVVVLLLGVVCGISYLQTGSVRSSMLTHSFTVVTWRLLFS